VVLLAAAAVIADARDLLLAAAILAAVVWIGSDAVRGDRPGPRSRLVMTVALGLLAALPALLLAADHGLWAGPVPSLDAGLGLLAIGILSVALGSRLTGVLPLPTWLTRSRAGAGDQPGQRGIMRTGRPRGRGPHLALMALVIASLAVFLAKVGGPSAYVHNLNNSAASTYGLTYLIWGMSFAKFGSFAYAGESWAQRRRPPALVICAAIVAIVLLLFIGSRLLLLIALVQLLLLYAALVPHGRRFRIVLVGAAVAGAVAFVLIGEFRRWENVVHHPSFPSYLVHKGLPELPRTYVNQYADAVRLSVLAREVVPRRAPYEYGKELLRVLLQMLPSEVRPTVGTAPALSATFTSGDKNGNALPVPVEGYIEFGLAGAIAFSLLLGLAVGLVDRIGAAASDVGALTAAIAAGTGAVIVMRGSLAQGIALAVIDVVGFFAAHRILYRLDPVRQAVATGAAEDRDERGSVPGAEMAAR
jgi:hypothetical protein